MELALIVEAENKFSSEIVEAFAEVQQPRTNFQIDNFVIKQHETAEMQYKQVLLELQDIYYNVKRLRLSIKKTEIEIERLRATGDEIDEIEAQIKELGLEQTGVVALGSLRELEHLLGVYNSFGHKFSRDEIESGQSDYWNQRLHRQAILETVGGSQAQAAHLEALRQIGAIEVTKSGVNTVDEMNQSSDKELT